MMTVPWDKISFEIPGSFEALKISAVNKIIGAAFSKFDLDLTSTHHMSNTSVSQEICCRVIPTTLCLILKTYFVSGLRPHVLIPYSTYTHTSLCLFVQVKTWSHNWQIKCSLLCNSPMRCDCNGTCYLNINFGSFVYYLFCLISYNHCHNIFKISHWVSRQEHKFLI